MKKKYGQFLLIFAFALAILFVLPLSLYHASASIFTSEENERYAIQINELGCELMDYEIHVDLWHLSITGNSTVTLNNSGDTGVSIGWNVDGAHEEIIIPANTVKKYGVNFYFHLLSRDFSYEYEEIY